MLNSSGGAISQSAHTYAHARTLKISNRIIHLQEPADKRLIYIFFFLKQKQTSAVWLRAAFQLEADGGRDAEEGEDARTHARSSPSRPLLIDPLSARKQQITEIETSVPSQNKPRSHLPVSPCAIPLPSPLRKKEATLSTFFFPLFHGVVCPSFFLHVSAPPPNTPDSDDSRPFDRFN